MAKKQQSAQATERAQNRSAKSDATKTDTPSAAGQQPTEPTGDSPRPFGAVMDAQWQMWQHMTALGSEMLQNYATQAQVTGAADPARTPKTLEPPAEWELLARVTSQLFSGMAEHPEEFSALQRAYTEQMVSLLRDWQAQSPSPTAPVRDTPVRDTPVRDKRFANSLWQQPYFALVREMYATHANTISEMVGISTQSLDATEKRRVEFIVQQFVDALSPSNFPATNPQVIDAAIDSNGLSFIEGMRNLARDLHAGGGKLHVPMAQRDAFVLGEDIACTQGKVVLRTPLFELIEYAPVTDQVLSTPLLMVPPWINKYYVLDLEPRQSYMLWLVEQGIRVFIISWVNPDKSLAETDYADYLQSGVLPALEAVEAITGSPQTHLMGYCLGGTTVATFAAWLAAKQQETRLASLTMLTTLLDFEQSGDLCVFVDEQQIAAIEAKMKTTGVMEGRDMATTFQTLRANDLLWSFYVNNYLLGKEPPVMALLQWNSDPTRLPAKMHSFYLRNMYLRNLLREPKGVSIADTPIELSKVTTPQFLLGTVDDHIAPWQNCFRSIALLGGESTFVLAGSGHIAGVINHPARQKYGYRTLAAPTPTGTTPEAFLAQAIAHEGSWWPHWLEWLLLRSAERVPAPKKQGNKAYPALGEAPGTYVKG